MKARINGRALAYDDHGIGLPIFFLHAFPLNRSMWTGVSTALLTEQRYRLVALDWQGFGESEIGENETLNREAPFIQATNELRSSDIQAISMESLADDVAGLMDQLGMEQAVLCGLSMGGYVAFAFLRKYPQKVKALILADTKPESDSQEVKESREKVARVAEAQGSAAIADLQVPRLLTARTRREREEIEGNVRRMIDGASSVGIAAAARGMARRADSSDLLSHIEVPTLVIVGEEDVVTPPKTALEYASKIVNARVEIIPQAGHLSNLEQEEQFLNIIRNFLATLA